MLLLLLPLLTSLTLVAVQREGHLATGRLFVVHTYRRIPGHLPRRPVGTNTAERAKLAQPDVFTE